MSDAGRLSFGEFLADLRGVVVSPRRRFPAIHERAALWGSLFLLIAPAYLPLSYLGGVFFTSDPFPGYSLLMPMVGAVISVAVKLFGIHFVARLFEGKWHYRAATGRFRDLSVVFGYTGLPSIIAMVAALVIFIGFGSQASALMREFRAATISVLIACGIALFIWNLILMVLALRDVYPIRDYKLVISVLVGPFLVAVPLLAGSLAVNTAHIRFDMVAPLLNEKVTRFISNDPESQESGRNKISYHIDLFCYRMRPPGRFELVAFTPLPDPGASKSGKGSRVMMASGMHMWFSDELRNQFAGRIAGLPGDEVELVKGGLWVNGKRWNENYLCPECVCDASVAPTKLGPSEYLVLPEDRHLIDSNRNQLIVDRARITGRLILNRLPLGWWFFRPTAFQHAVPEK